MIKNMDNIRLHELIKRWYEADLTRQEEDELLKFARLFQAGEDVGFIISDDDISSLYMIGSIDIVAEEGLLFTDESASSGEAELEAFLSALPEKRRRGFGRRRMIAALWSAAAVALIVFLFAAVYNVRRIDRQTPEFAKVTSPATPAVLNTSKPVSTASAKPLSGLSAKPRMAVNASTQVKEIRKENSEIKEIPDNKREPVTYVSEIKERKEKPEELEISVSDELINKELAVFEMASNEMKEEINTTLRDANEEVLAIFKDLSNGISDVLDDKTLFRKEEMNDQGYSVDCFTPECILAAAFDDIFDDRPGIKEDINNSLRDIFPK